MAIQTLTLIDNTQIGDRGAYATSSIPPFIPITASLQAKIFYTSSNGLEEVASTPLSTLYFNPLSFNSDALIIPTENDFVNIPTSLDNIIVTNHNNDVGGMYIPKYEVTNIINNNDDYIFDFWLLENSGSFMSINQSITLQGNTIYKFTGSLRVYKSNLNDPNSLGTPISEHTFTIPDFNSTGEIAHYNIYSGEYKHDDIFRFAVKSLNKTPVAGLSITEYSCSIEPTYTRFSMNPENLGNLVDTTYKTGFNEAQNINLSIPNYYGANVLPWNFATNCQPLINNAINNRSNSHLMDVNYTNLTGSLIPINQSQLINFTATRASIPDSNYTSTRIINPRYKGSKSISNKLNVWTPKDIGTYGKLPTVESRKAIFGYFDNIIDPYPNINNKVQLRLTYLIDEQGNALPPNIEKDDGLNVDYIFNKNSKTKISLNESSGEFKELNSPHEVFMVNNYVAPIMYSQTSSMGYSTQIPLTGSSNISLYDNNNDSSFTNLAFTAEGTPSDASIIQTQSVNTVFNLPNVVYKTGGTTGNSYNTSTGEIYFSNDGFANDGETTSQDYNIYFETSFATNFIYESGKPEMNIKLSLKDLTTGNNIPFTFEDIKLKVHIGENIINLGSIIDKNNDVVRFKTQKLQQSIGLNNNNELEMVFENYAIQSILITNNLYVKGQGGSEFKGNIDALEWVINANTNNYNTKKLDRLQWNFKGEIIGGKTRTNYFFPNNYNGLVFPTKLTMIGSKNHLFENDNLGTAPFWVYTGSAGGGTNIFDRSMLVMSSSNINEAYGLGYKQGDIKYIPGPSDTFPEKFEPEGTKFDSIQYSLEIKEGDQIRFGNNETYSYTIKRVYPPQENIEDGVGRIKIKLDKEVPTSVNKDFFLVRRNILSQNTIMLNTPFMYNTPTLTPSSEDLWIFETPNSTGILYPEYPTELLNISASYIVEDLVDKGVIK